MSNSNVKVLRKQLVFSLLLLVPCVVIAQEAESDDDSTLVYPAVYFE